MKNSKAGKPGKWKRVLITVLCVLLALILAAVACVGVYVNYLMGKIQRVDMGNESVISPSQVEDMLATDPDLSPMDPSESLPDIGQVVLPEEDPVPVGKPDHVINILLIGQDSRGEAVRARSDSMILVTVNTKSKEVTFTSFMRDAYVKIPGYSDNKLNHAYQYGGMKLLNETLRVNFGVEVDGNVEVNFAQFKEIIDLLGGVEITLTEAEARYLNHPSQWGLVAGKNRLNGEQALVYARLREIDNDYRRTERQRTVLMALLEAYKDQPVDRMFTLLEELMGYVTTNMSNAQMWQYALQVIPILSGVTVGTQQIPAEGTFSQGIVQVRPGLKAWFQYEIDFEANRERLRRIFDTL